MKLENLITRIKNHGGRMTPNRELIVKKLLLNINSLVTADELLRQCKEDNPGINLTTIYRNLDTLEELELIHQISINNSTRGYKLITVEHHHHHLVCRDCGKTIPIDYCPLSDELLEIAKQNHFNIEDVNLDFFGKCQQCS